MTHMLKLATALPALALLSACATTAPTVPTSPSESVTDAAYDRMMPERYTCTDDAQIMAKQSINKQQAMVTATVPKIRWSQQQVILNGGVQGDTASYANDSNPEVAYAWHMKGDKGILAMKWTDGTEYQVNCEKR
ncbi:hypothetical protein ES754_08805 [Psychrobacter frigidicola]|uniref:C-type lysozyme inhibitor domain-containing protein n=1 Tax=Psychrobacter frigidicola TaxID=45611 RepID=A0A5C7A192_9GAMM|nr:hypothetical protein [Psychrobacter frigidicola]TXD97098.1 hypothetical protein ES754_08805 [Psychrobacter frigidicola]